MLDQMRKNSRSLLITVLFLIIIAVFIINFGPQSRGSSCEQAMGEDHYAAKVGRQAISSSTFRYGFMMSGGDRFPPKMAKQEHLKEGVLDKLIERELLVGMADKLGFVVTDDDVDDQIAEGKIMTLGGAAIPVPMLQKDGRFNAESFKTFVRVQLQQTPDGFLEEQKKELLATRVRNLVRSGVTVSPDEVKAEFIRKNRQVNLEYMRFTSRRQEAEVAPTAEEIAAFASKNEAKLKEIYDQKKFLYEKAPPQRHIRQILVKVPHDTDEKAEKADKAAREKADALVEKLKKSAKSTGKNAVTFVELAKTASDDTATKARGGDLGWRARGGANLAGDAEDKLFTAKDGAIVGPFKAADGYIISKVEGSREGHIPFEAAKTELAEEKLRQEMGVTRAKAAAEAALAKAKAAPTSTLKTIYPPPSDTQEASATDTGAPRVEETGLFALRATPEGAVVEGIGVSNEVAKAAFALTAEAPIAGPFTIGDNFYIIRLKERKDPDLAEFEKRKLELAQEAEQAKGEHVLSDWTHAACVEAKEARRISVNLDILKYGEEQNEQVSYEPCSVRRGLFGG
jgi:peptidyl-prolyl cis-trans isomerase D